MGVDTDLYNAVLVLHILAVVIGFGGMFIAGFYGNEAKNRPGPEGLAVAETTLAVTGKIPTIAVCAVPILGILLILMSDDVWKFSEAWISISFLLYFVLMGLATGVQVPAIRRMVAMRSTGEGSMAELVALGKKVATVSAVVNVLWVVILILMVFKPGH